MSIFQLSRALWKKPVGNLKLVVFNPPGRLYQQPLRIDHVESITNSVQEVM
jgi:hypothetical protein